MGGDRGLQLSPTLVAMTELSSDSFFLLDRDHRITYINRTAEGLSVQDAIGTEIFALLTEDQAKVARAAFKRAAETGEKTSYEITFPLPDGRLSRWATRIAPQRDGSFVVVSSDVTEHASAREELDLLFALSQDLLFVTGYDGVFQRVNPAVVDALGHSFDDMTARPFLEFVHPDDRARTDASFREVVEHGADVRFFENRYQTKDGRYRLLQWSARPDPASRRVIAIARDVTESRALEQQLRQSQKMDAMGQLAGGVAHDINNVLQTIFGAVDIANNVVTSAQLRDPLHDIETAAERAADLVRQLLVFSRKQPFCTARANVSELLEAPIELLRRVLPATIEVRVTHSEEAQYVLADRTQIEQAIVNLCLNARDAMPHGGTLIVQVESIEVGEGVSSQSCGVQPGRYVAINVIDTGTGMTPEVRERMFEPFFTTKPMGLGTGLGMSMVYGAVTRHGGSVQVESQVGHGTRVRLLLPAQAESAAMRAHANTDRPVRHAAGQELILVADDEPQVRRLCVRTLEEAGYTVLAATNGAEAIELARTNGAIDLFLLDVVMPNMTGPQAFAEIRRLHPDAPVLFSSGYADVSRHSHAVPADAPLLAKPLRMAQLLAAIRDLLDRRTLSK